MSRLILHRAFGSPPARSVMMLGEMIGVQFEIKEVNILRMEHKTPEFKKLNPMTTVPVLQDGDFVLSESHAIMKYLLGKYGADKKEVLYPSELRTQAIVDQCMYFNAGVFFKAFTAVTLDTFINNLQGPTEMHIFGIENSYSVLEAYLQDKKYVATNHLTLADLSNGATATAIQGMHKVDPNKFPRCADWLARLQEEHVFKTINAPGAAFLAKLLNKLWQANKENE